MGKSKYEKMINKHINDVYTDFQMKLESENYLITGYIPGGEPRISKSGRPYKVYKVQLENSVWISTQMFNKYVKRGFFSKNVHKKIDSAKMFERFNESINNEFEPLIEVVKPVEVKEEPTKYEIVLTSVVEPVEVKEEPVEVKEIERDEYVRKLVQENDFYGICSAYTGIRDARGLINGLLLESLCVLDNYVTSDNGICKEDFIEDTFVYIVKETNNFIDRTFKDVFKENEEEGMNWFATACVQELRYLLQEKRLLEIIEEKFDEYMEDVKEELPFIRVVEPDKYSKEFKNLTPKEAKRKMRELSKQLHPDLHPELDGTEFRKMYDAYEKHMSRVA